MIGPIVSAALWAVLASLALSAVIGAAVAGWIHFFRPAAVTRQALWSVALGAAGLAPVAILAAMLVRGALGSASDDMPAITPPAASAQHTPAASHANTLVPQRSGAVSRSAIQPNPQPAHASAAHLPAPPDVAPLVAQTIVIVWALGALAGLIGLGRSLARVRGLKLRSSALDGDLAGELPWLTDLPGREIYLRLTYETETPIAVGFRRPVILIPTEMATAAGLTSIEPLVMHEYAHLSRYDDWTNLVQRAIERVFWFNPLVWILGRRLALEREVAADEAVVARTHDAKNYASALWRMAQEMRMPEHVVVAPGAMLTRKQISVRIERLLDDAPVARRRFGAAAFAAAALALTGVAGVAATAPPVVLATPEAPMAAASAAPMAVAWTPAATASTAAATATSASTMPARIANRTALPAVASAVASAAVATTAARASAAHAAATAYAATAAQSNPAPPAVPHVPVPPLPNASEIAAGVLSEPDVQNLKKLGSQISADVMRQLAEQRRQVADQHREVSEQQRQVADQQRQIAEQRRQLADAHPELNDANDDGDRTAPAGKLTRELVAACMACNFANRDLRGLNLSGLTLTGDDFSRANLENANFSHSKLRGVSFARAALTGAQFAAAELFGVDFSRAHLDGANFTNASLTGTNLAHASMNGANLNGIHLVGSTLP